MVVVLLLCKITPIDGERDFPCIVLFALLFASYCCCIIADFTIITFILIRILVVVIVIVKC